MRPANWLCVASLLLSACGPGGPGEPGPCGDTRFCEPGEPCFEATCDAQTRCAQGLEASYYGRSGTEAGTCVADDAAACARSSVACRVWGQCSLAPETRPGFLSSAPCRRVRSDQDFQASRLPACAGRGTCVAIRYERCNDEGGECVITRDDCRDSQVCALEGRCTASGGICIATTDVDCARGSMCRTSGQCRVREDGFCTAREVVDCQRSDACTKRGECGVRGGSCVACGRSEACAKRGECTFDADRCVRCEAAADCRTEGLCAFAGGRCRATSAQHCKVSTACRRDGRCRPSTRGNCVR